MALSLPFVDIINPQNSNGFLLEENMPEMFNLCYEACPSHDMFFHADDYRSFGSSVISFNQMNEIFLPSCNSNNEKINDCNKSVNTIDESICHVNQYDNTSMNGERMYMEVSPYVLSYPITSHIDYIQESLKQEKVSQKRKFEGVERQTPKKQCESNRKTKASTNPSKDTQSLAAKNRRERISERLKVLQELVPNGTKVDLVTMLEKAISYVKFLQLQVKVLATDEFWPAQGGKSPDISQVKEAIDAILSSVKETSSEVNSNQK